MIGLLAAAMVVATPAPPARVRIDCPFVPIFFENGRRDIDEPGRRMLAVAYDWVLDRAREDVRIVLTTATREPASNADAAVAQARADAVRAALVAEGVPADHIIVAHDYRSGPNFGPEGWMGGWVYLDFYVPPSFWPPLTPGLPVAVC